MMAVGVESVPTEELRASQNTNTIRKNGHLSSRDEDWIKSIINAGDATNSNSNDQSQTQKRIKSRMHKVPEMLQARKDFQKYFVPQVVSIGPYHHGNPVLEQVEKLKPHIASKFVSKDPTRLGDLYEKILLRICEVREYYDEESTRSFTDETFARMILLDGCFVLNYIWCVINGSEDDLGMKRHHINFAQQDLFLLENQLPFNVLEDLIDTLEKDKWMNGIYQFVRKICFVRTFQFEEEKQPSHLLHLLRKIAVGVRVEIIPGRAPFKFIPRRSHNMKELMAIGIQLDHLYGRSLTDINLTSHGSYAQVRLPYITVNGSTKSMFLNLIADEMSSDEANELWVTSYICFLSTLIAHPDDVKILRSAEVLNCLSSDEEVSSLFHELAIDLVPNPYAYQIVNIDIDMYCHSNKNWSSWLGQFRRYKAKMYMSQLKEDYFKNPWSIFALIGATLALLFTGAQAYFQIWSPPGECESLCNYIKTTHRL